MSESWEREDNILEKVVHLENYEIISNVYQRKGIAGRPALFINKRNFEVKNETNKLIQIPWGVEAVWCLLTPRNVSGSSKIKKIA